MAALATRALLACLFVWRCLGSNVAWVDSNVTDDPNSSCGNGSNDTNCTKVTNVTVDAKTCDGGGNGGNDSNMTDESSCVGDSNDTNCTNNTNVTLTKTPCDAVSTSTTVASGYSTSAEGMWGTSNPQTAAISTTVTAPDNTTELGNTTSVSTTSTGTATTTADGVTATTTVVGVTATTRVAGATATTSASLAETVTDESTAPCASTNGGCTTTNAPTTAVDEMGTIDVGAATGTTASAPTGPEGSSLQADPTNWLEEVARKEAAMVNQVLASASSTPVSLTVGGLTMAAFQVGPSSGKEVSVTLEGTTAEVSLPASVLSIPSLQGAIFVASAQEEQKGFGSGQSEDGSVVEVQGGMTVSFLTPDLLPIPVDGLAEPILVTLPLQRGPDSECAYWDKISKRWLSKGLVNVGAVGEAITCATTHLTFFASIGKGFLRTLQCTHLNLISREGFAALLEGDWYRQPIVICWWLILLGLIAMMLVALRVDAKQASASEHWTDEAWLINSDFMTELNSFRASQSMEQIELPSSPTSPPTSPSRHEASMHVHFEEESLSPRNLSPSLSPRGKEEAPARRERSASKGSVTPSVHSRATTRSSASTRSTRSTRSMHIKRSRARKFCVWLRHNSALRDAVDDLISRWFHCISEVRDLIESVCEGFTSLFVATEEDRGKPCLRRAATRLSRVILGPMIARTVRRQAAATLGLTPEVVTFLTEDQRLQEILLQAPPFPDQEDRFSERIAHWMELHDSVVSAIDEQWRHSGHWSGFPKACRRLFLSSNPFIRVYRCCHFWTCRLRALFLASELLGALLVVTIFFHFSGDASGKRTRGNCRPSQSPGEQTGRLLAVGVASLLVANLPVVALSSLHARSFKTVPTDGGEEWQRQLLVWKIQDTLLWILGLVYIAFCTAFVTLFLANISSDAMSPWGLTGAISLLQDLLVVPVSVGLFVPVPPMAMLSVLSLLENMDKAELLRLKRSQWEEGQGNWFRMISSV